MATVKSIKDIQTKSIDERVSNLEDASDRIECSIDNIKDRVKELSDKIGMMSTQDSNDIIKTKIDTLGRIIIGICVAFVPVFLVIANHYFK